MNRLQSYLSALLALALISGCDQAAETEQLPAGSDIEYRVSGRVEWKKLDEISGIQASRSNPGVYWVHNDRGASRLSAIDINGKDLGSVKIEDATNADWEDITLIPGTDSDTLVIADIGDNHARRTKVWLYFLKEPQPDKNGRYDGKFTATHRLAVTYPDGPRDAESIAYDPISGLLLILTKRDKPPRLYAVGAQSALQSNEAELEFIGEIDHFVKDPNANMTKRAWHASQPTGLDISPDASQAAIISYRSLYLFDLQPGTDWQTSLGSTPIEIIGPPHVQEESVGFSEDGKEVIVTAEDDNPPIYQYRLKP